ncbi:MAG: single-stranded-DNA-specific exonuclease RecJ [Alphaproteobacteria bacterium]
MPGAGQDRAAFLGVSQSLTGQRWFLSQTDDRLVHALAQRHGLPDIVARVLAARGVGLENADDFLNPTLRKLLPDPSRFLDLEKAAERIAAAIINGEQIAIFGDYDVDGATSSALLSRFFRAVGTSSVTYIPDRIREGYGPNAAAFEKLKSGGAQVVITVDCGTTAYEALKAGQTLGLDVIVADHHQADGALPPGFALINPNRPDEADDIVADYGQLAAVGVAFLLVVGINRSLRARGWYRDKQEPNPLDWLDLVALGTVCDVVPLTGINRALVSQGLKVMGKRRNPGIQALAAVAGLDEPPGTYHAGFVFGPRVNAGGRVGRSDMGARLLSTDDPAEAAALAQELDTFNDERKAIEAAVQEEAMAQLVDIGEGAPIVIAAGEGWHPGVIGIVASRIKDKTRRPTFVIALDEGVGKGSGRSIPGVDLGAAVTAAAQAGLLVNGGGHKMAAGLTVKADQLDDLKTFLTMHLAPLVTAAGAETGLRIDASLAVAGATPDLIELLEQAGPFGSGHREPRFALPQARLISADIVGENHVRCIVGGRDGGRLKAIAFRSMDGPLGPALLSAARSKTALNLAGHLRADRWMGRLQAQLLIDDAAPVMQPPDNAVT